jgi:hypothetical protein
MAVAVSADGRSAVSYDDGSCGCETFTQGAELASFFSANSITGMVATPLVRGW